MSLKDRVWAFHLSHMSKPAEDRPIYQELLQGQAKRILELGVGQADRSLRMIETASRDCDAREIYYTGVGSRTPPEGCLSEIGTHRGPYPACAGGCLFGHRSDC